MTAPMNAIFNNPYHPCGAVLARVAVNFATLIWSIVVLLIDDALRPTPYGLMMVSYMPEDFYAWFFLTISLVMLYRIFRQSKPHALGIIGYGILGAAWLYVDVIVIFFQRPMYPTATAWVTVGTVIAVYGFVANPRTCRHVAAR